MHQSDGFYLDVDAWDSSKAVQRMTFTEEGVYFAMIRYLWSKRFLPDSAEGVADLIATTPQKHADVLAAWPAVRRCFVLSEKGPARIYNVRLEKTRRQQVTYYRKRAAAGRTGGKASARKRRGEQELTVNDRSTTVQRPSSDKRREEESREDLKREEGNTTARSRRPIFSGQRLTVFEWQLDDCRKTLQEHTNDFGLDEFFAELDTQAVRSGLVIPKRDGGVWLQAQLVAEAQRRGLPLRLATVPVEALGKQSTRLLSAVAGLKGTP